MSRPRDADGAGRGIWALVPIKSFDAAKKRLAGMLDADERRALMLAMARDVLTALSGSRRLAGILIVSRSPEVDVLADSFGTARFAESPGTDLPGALAEAAGHAAGHHRAEGVFIVPADVPLVGAHEIDALLEQHRQVTLLPDRNRVGTNGLILSPHDAIELVFDGKSFGPHLERARAAGIAPAVVADGGFALDVDTPGDLGRLLQLGPDTETGLFLNRAGIAGRLPGGIPTSNS